MGSLPINSRLPPGLKGGDLLDSMMLGSPNTPKNAQGRNKFRFIFQKGYFGSSVESSFQEGIMEIESHKDLVK